MKIFFDLDETIFATHLLKRDMNDFLRSFQLSHEDIANINQRFVGVPQKNGEIYSQEAYSEKIATMVNGDIDWIQRRVREFFDRDFSPYIYHDVLLTLAQFPKEDLILLTFGNEHFQGHKIQYSGIGQYFSDVIITQRDKSCEITDYMNGLLDDVVVLIDDKKEYFESVKKLPFQTVSVHMIRDGGMCCDKTCDHHIDQFAQVCDILLIK